MARWWRGIWMPGDGRAGSSGRPRPIASEATPPRSAASSTAPASIRSSSTPRSNSPPLLSGADWIVDGLLGTGLTREVEGTIRSLVEAVNASGIPTLALDLPSGLDCDTGQPLGNAVRARLTATFVARKVGFGAPGAGDYTGDVRVVEIGVPGLILEPFQGVR